MTRKYLLIQLPYSDKEQEFCCFPDSKDAFKKLPTASNMANEGIKREQNVELSDAEMQIIRYFDVLII